MKAGYPAKPLGRKAYGSIGHLPGSRLGPGDHTVHEGQARICLETARDEHDTIIVQEKLDGSCMAVAKIDGEIVPLGRKGYPAISSRFEQHRLFHEWCWQPENRERFLAVLEEGEWLVGEWLAQAHGTRYMLSERGPFFIFDLFSDGERLGFSARVRRLQRGGSDYQVPAWVSLPPRNQR